MSRAMEYSGATKANFAQPSDTFQIWDKPAEKRLMIGPSLAKAGAQGVGTGLTFGIVQPGIDMPAMETAAVEYLKSTGHSCTITSRDLVLHPQWEFKYSCSG